MRLTEMTLRTIPFPAAGQVTHFDDSLPGFGIRVSVGGTKSFVLIHGRHRERLTLGRYPIISLAQAREKAKNILAERKLGNGAAPRITYQTAHDAFIAHCERKNRSKTVKDYKRLLKRHFPFGTTPLRDISRLDISTRLDKLTETPAEQNYAFRVIRHFFRFCLQKGYATQTPCAGMTTPSKLKSRDRVLTDEELYQIWHACRGQFGNYVRCLILLAQRRGELRKAIGDTATITIPAHVAKNGRELTIPLPAFALPFWTPPFSNFAWSREKKELDKRAGVTGWTLHDLRRTAATGMAQLDVAPHIIEKILNHSTGTVSGVAAVYNRNLYLPQMKAALETWADYIQTHIAPYGGMVADGSPAERALCGVAL
jgi:integrase